MSQSSFDPAKEPGAFVQTTQIMEQTITVVTLPDGRVFVDGDEVEPVEQTRSRLFQQTVDRADKR